MRLKGLRLLSEHEDLPVADRFAQWPGWTAQDTEVAAGDQARDVRPGRAELAGQQLVQTHVAGVLENQANAPWPGA